MVHQTYFMSVMASMLVTTWLHHPIPFLTAYLQAQKAIIVSNFLREIIFVIFAMHLLSVKFSSLKFRWQIFGLQQLESQIHRNKNICLILKSDDDTLPPANLM